MGVEIDPPLVEKSEMEFMLASNIGNSSLLDTAVSFKSPSPLTTYPTVTSKMLEPTEEETAMSPKPFLATMTLVMRSGMEVPAARKVRPIT